MLTFLRNFNFLIMVLFTIGYFYQMVYLAVGFVKKDHTSKTPAKELHKFAIVISARNESRVIGELLKSINNQNYPRELFETYVIADNCTDNTAEIAEENGAIVYRRFNQQLVGKGYALDYLFRKISSTVGVRAYDGYIIFDADNVLDKNYIAEMNKVFDKGYRVITGYRNSKNYDSSWVSAGHALWFLRESRYTNGPRMMLHTGCAVSGTGFLVSSEVVQENGGWVHHLLTEDIEFTVDMISKGEKIGYCSAAVLYDEQPILFRESWKQRMRWAKGFYQVFYNYAGKLAKGTMKGSFQCYDMLMTVSPAMLVTLFSLLVNLGVALISVFTASPGLVRIALWNCVVALWGNYFSVFIAGALTTFTEWKNIHCSNPKKIWYMFTFPIYFMSYVPISVVALFKDVQWKPIEHSISKSLYDIER